jgi:hypothetical protein
MTQQLQRVVSRPDILFTGRYLGPSMDGASLNGTSNWVNNGAPGADGPGIIQPPAVIAFNRFGPSFADIDEGFPFEAWPQWGSFDGTSAPPIAFPLQPAGGGLTTLYFQFVGLNVGGVFSAVLPGQSNAVSLLQSSTDLTNWSTMTRITNLGGTFTGVESIRTNIPQIYFRSVPE